MSKKTKMWLAGAFSLTLIGCVILGGVMTVLGWDFSKLSTVSHETNDYTVREDFRHISVVTKTANVVLVATEDTKASVVCHEQKNLKHRVTVADGTLTVEVVDVRKWYEYIGISFGSPCITVYLPRGEYGALSVKSDTGDVDVPKDFRFERIDIAGSTGDVTNGASASEAVKIKTSTGHIRVENISAQTLEFSVSTGGITASGVACEEDMTLCVSTGRTVLTDVTCQNLTSSGSTGGISLKNVIVSQTLSVRRSTGDVTFDGCDGAEIDVETDTGDVTGCLLTDKVFLTQTDTGRVSVPETVTGGPCRITTDTGDIRITIS
ncbi:MAG: DUF4097 domain-containing protein [Ruminococcaceae bacterium]|nr:DUF4097 domain-containing protein [Oscillospiraceae bacterium]